MEFVFLAHGGKVARHSVAFDLSAKGQRMPGLGSEYDVVAIQAAFESARLVRAFAMPGYFVAILLKIDGLGVEVSVPVLRFNDPMTCEVDGRALLAGQRCLSRDKLCRLIEIFLACINCSILAPC